MSLIGVNRRRVLKLAGAVTTTIAGGAMVGVAEDENEDEENEENEEEEENENENEEAEIELADQSGHHSTIYVNEAKLPEGGFIVIHHMDHDSDGRIIGHSPVLRCAEYENLPVEIDTLESGDHKISAMAHKDDPHNGTLDFPAEGDPPYKDDDGNIVQDLATVTF